MIKFIPFLLLAFFLFSPSVNAAVFYADFSCATPGNGSSPTCSGGNAPFHSVDNFTEAARTAGDILFVRRGQATTTGISTVDFTSDGTSTAPIIVSADYDNIWGDFATSTQTFTITQASTTLISSASTTGIAAGDWIYVVGDCTENPSTTSLNTCKHAYEVRTVTSAAITLYMPYKGKQSGSGLSLRVMPDNPIWGTVAGDFNWALSGDNFWILKGFNLRGTFSSGVLSITSSEPVTVEDFIVEGNGVTVTPIQFASSENSVLNKIRTFDNSGLAIGGGSASKYIVTNFYIDCDNTSFAVAIGDQSSGASEGYYFDGYIQNCTSAMVNSSNGGMDKLYARNIRTVSVTDYVASQVAAGVAGDAAFVAIEDFNGSIGENRYVSYLNTAASQYLLQSTTTQLRAGGGPVSLRFNPTTDLNILYDWNTQKLFEYPIYADDSSKQYDVYFMSPSDTWTTNPTAAQLWIECEYLVSVGGTTYVRKTKKSTGTVDFNGSTAWQSLSVTCDPDSAGLLYLRAWYGKTKEAGTNLFYVDGTPVIS